MGTLRVGVALCGSFCTFKQTMDTVGKMVAEGFDVTPIMSFHASTLNTRFGKAEEFIERLYEMTGKQVIKTIEDAEPIGPKNMLDVLLVAPCTGNTLAKIAYAVNDTPVTMAVKSHLRNNKPVLLALATNDALGASGKNLGAVLNTKNIYFVPFRQDAPDSKPKSIVSNFDLVIPAIYKALDGEQLQPIIL